MTKLELLRKKYGVPAKRGGRVRCTLISGERTGTIVGATTCGDLRVHFDGDPKNQVHLVYLWRVTYLDEQE